MFIRLLITSKTINWQAKGVFRRAQLNMESTQCGCSYNFCTTCISNRTVFCAYCSKVFTQNKSCPKVPNNYCFNKTIDKCQKWLPFTNFLLVQSRGINDISDLKCLKKLFSFDNFFSQCCVEQTVLIVTRKTKVKKIHMKLLFTNLSLIFKNQNLSRFYQALKLKLL